jgi:hypothetical protein
MTDLLRQSGQRLAVAVNHGSDARGAEGHATD